MVNGRVALWLMGKDGEGMNERTDGQADGRLDGRTDGWAKNMDDWMDVWTDGRADCWTDVCGGNKSSNGH